MVPGVFWFENTDSFFVESTAARPAMPVLIYPAIRALLPVREVLEPIASRILVTAPARPCLDRYSPRSFVAVSPPAGPESSDDH